LIPCRLVVIATCLNLSSFSPTQRWFTLCRLQELIHDCLRDLL
jgi:hypothetical protein